MGTYWISDWDSKFWSNEHWDWNVTAICSMYKHWCYCNWVFHWIPMIIKQCNQYTFPVLKLCTPSNVAFQHKIAEPSNPIKVLGLFWITQSDQIYLTPSADAAISYSTTNWEILRWSSSIFDPLGFISPVMIPEKILIQQLIYLFVYRV